MRILGSIVAGVVLFGVVAGAGGPGVGGVDVRELSVPEASLPAAAGASFDRGDADYWWDFENLRQIPREWTARRRFVTQDDYRRGMLGKFYRGSRVRLRLPDLPPHAAVRLYVQVYLFGPWRGTDTRRGSGLLEIQAVDGPRLWYASVRAMGGGAQSHPMPYRCGSFPGFTGGSRVVGMTVGRHCFDFAAVYPMVLTFRHDSPELVLAFRSWGGGSSPWALDEVGIQLLDRFPEVELTPGQFQRAVAQLGDADPMVGLQAMERLIASGDAGVDGLVQALGGGANDPERRAVLADLERVFEHDDYKQWDEALQLARELGPHFEAACAYRIGRRIARGDAPGWIDELLDPEDGAVPVEETRLRAVRAAWVLEQIWSPKARAALLVDEVAP